MIRWTRKVKVHIGVTLIVLAVLFVIGVAIVEVKDIEIAHKMQQMHLWNL